jgi:2-polyprenyl-3-methyl-5-hydroxy-6-metoxy-1,4-benzoquinol methylase
MSHLLARVARRAVIAYYRVRARHAFRGIARGRRDTCWCDGGLIPFTWHKGYGRCSRCGTYVNRRPPTVAGLARLYSFEPYWILQQRACAFPPIQERGTYYLNEGRTRFWLDLVGRYGPPGGQAIEIGCAPGVLLSLLQQQGFVCVGVEPSESTAAWVREHYTVDVRTGLFPDVDLPPCDLLLAFDVLEHSRDPLRFMMRASELLTPGGVAIVQTPIDRDKLTPPFGARFPDAFAELEHLFLFTDEAMAELAARCGLTIQPVSERMWILGEVSVFRKPGDTVHQRPRAPLTER